MKHNIKIITLLSSIPIFRDCVLPLFIAMTDKLTICNLGFEKTPPTQWFLMSKEEPPFYVNPSVLVICTTNIGTLMYVCNLCQNIKTTCNLHHV